MSGEVRNVDGGVRDVDGGVRNVDGEVRNVDGGVRDVDGGVRNVDGGVRDVDGGVRDVDGRVRNVDDGVFLLSAFSDVPKVKRRRLFDRSPFGSCAKIQENTDYPVSSVFSLQFKNHGQRIFHPDDLSPLSAGLPLRHGGDHPHRFGIQIRIHAADYLHLRKAAVFFHGALYNDTPLFAGFLGRHGILEIR